MPLKQIAQEAFSIWPKTELVAHQNALCYTHKISDVEFFFLDTQSQEKTNVLRAIAILGQEQIEWLKDALLTSTANFKIIVSGAYTQSIKRTKKLI